MAASRLAWLGLLTLSLAFLPTAQADGLDGVLDPAPHECQGPADYECSLWVCHGDPFTGCPFGCPGSAECVQVTCGLYVDTPTLMACFHQGVVPFVRCMAAGPHATCTDHLMRE